jgi:hypothetical protein
MRYQKENNPIRDSIYEMKKELIEYGIQIRSLKKILDTEFKNGLTEENVKLAYSKTHIKLNDLRTKCRYVHLIYGLIRGKKYSQMERNPFKNIGWYSFEKIVKEKNLMDYINIRQLIEEYMKHWTHK